ncbi:MAG: hypothetical protein AAGJ32_07070 [Pseudomonadota bacterium]
MKRLILASCAAVVLFAGTAGADAAGTIISVTGEQGSVVVLRNGEALPASPQLQLFEKDRLIVRADGAVDVSAEGCDLSFQAPAMAVIDESFCTAQSASLERVAEQTTGATASNSARAGLRLNTGTVTTAGGAGLGSIAVAAAAASGGGSSSGTGLAGSGEAGTVSGDGPVGSGSGTVGGPTAGNLNDAFDAGSGLDDGLFGFFEATSS